MGLYRNIAGIPDGSVGVSLYSPGLSFDLGEGSTFDPVLPSPFEDPAAYQQQQESAQDAHYAEMVARYDWLLNHSYAEVTAAGYYVTLDTGSVFQWSDSAHTSSTTYLPLYDIQQIENERGTAGALLLHLQEPELAKDTAGYAGGASSSSGSTTTYSDPIPDVAALPPVVPTNDGGVIFDPEIVVTNTYPVPGSTTTDTTTPTTATPLPVDTATAIKNNLFPLVTVAGVAVVALFGNELLRKRSKPVLVVGVGALFYMMAKK